MITMKFKKLKKLLSYTDAVEIVSSDGTIIESVISKECLKGNYDEYEVIGISVIDIFVDQIENYIKGLEIILKCSEVNILFQKENKACELTEVTLTQFKETNNVNIVDYKNIFITSDGKITLEPSTSDTPLDETLACLINDITYGDEREILEYFSSAFGNIVFNERIDFICDKYKIIRISKLDIWVPSKPTGKQLEAMRKLHELKVTPNNPRIRCCNSFSKQLWQEKVLSLFEEE